tara:strand:- start:467 stop:706 length:240 start_codon:yes stop_codon:yes gene_type:complete
MLQYIKWFWVSEEKNMDKLIRIMAVSRIENTYLKYKRNKRINTRAKNEIKALVSNIVPKKNKNVYSHTIPVLPYKKYKI